jgi:hypothetical protein
MMNEAAPMTGGMIIPPVPATATTAAEKTGLKPAPVIRGIVKVPVAATLPTALPLIMPMRPLATMDTFASPPMVLPARDIARSLINRPIPVSVRNAPKRMKRKI